MQTQRTPTTHGQSAGAEAKDYDDVVSTTSKDSNFFLYSQEILRKAVAVALPSHKRDDVLLAVLKELKKVTKELRATSSDKIYYYNGTHWEDTVKKEVGIFLRDLAMKLGAPENIVATSRGIKLLIEQAEIDLYSRGETIPNAINLANGTLDYITMKSHPHRREDYLKYCLPYNYNPNAKCDKWLRFLNEVLPDKELQRVVQEMAGSPMAGVKTQKLPYLYGDGCNGKSVLLEVLGNIYGKENVTRFSLENICDKRGLFLAQMVGKLINISTENGQKLGDTKEVKDYIAHEAKMVRELYGQPSYTDDYAPSICSANSLPMTDDHSNGLYRRFLFIPFYVTIPKDKINPHLIEELTEEAEGIMNWVVEGAKRLRLQGRYSESKASQRVADEYRIESDVVALFAEENEIVEVADFQSGILLSDMYKVFSNFCDECGHYTPSKNKFGKRLRGLGFKVVKGYANKTTVCATYGRKDEIPEDKLPY